MGGAKRDAELLEDARDRLLESELVGDEADGATSPPVHKCVFGFKCELCEKEKQLEESAEKLGRALKAGAEAAMAVARAEAAESENY